MTGQTPRDRLWYETLMISVVNNQERGAASTDAHAVPDPGVYYPDEVRKIVSASDARIWRDQVSLDQARLADWSDRQLFTLFAPDAGRILRRGPYASFLGLVSVRMIATLQSYRIDWTRVERASKYVKRLSGTAYPLATRAFWVDVPEGEFAEVDQIVMATGSNGSVTFRDFRAQTIAPVCGLEFDGEHATVWRPAPGIWINPQYQGGLPCVDGTRVTTSTLWTFSGEGISAAEIADDFDLTEPQVEAAIAWHSSLAALDA